MATTTAPGFPEEAFRALVRAAPDGVVVAADDGTILLANPELEHLTGYDAGELIGKSIDRLVPDAARAGHAAQRATFTSAASKRPMGAGLELWARRKDGTLLAVEIMLARMSLAGLSATVAFVRDATDRRRQQEALHAHQAELEHANAAAEAANRELEAFSYSVAHDLRSPLRSIDGFSQALLEDYHDDLDAAGREYLRRVRAAAQRMGSLIDDLLALARLSRSELHREQVDVARLVRDVEARLRLVHPERQVELAVDDDLVIDADPRLLQVALENLLGNAWKFSRDRDVAHVSVRRDGAAIVVRDDGVGFDMAHAAALFAPFKRLHSVRDFEGTGIGLATVARVVHRHGGRIWAEASPGEGAAFFFTLREDEP